MYVNLTTYSTKQLCSTEMQCGGCGGCGGGEDIYVLIHVFCYSFHLLMLVTFRFPTKFYSLFL